MCNVGCFNDSKMIAYVKGKITFRSPAFIYVETGSIGYQVHITLNTYTKIERQEEILLWTHLHIKEDSHTLYGFYDQEERELFVHLLSVSGVGPNTARILLSSLSPQEVRRAIQSDDELTFKQVKGIGSKTAKQIILDLKGKISKTDSINISTASPGNNTLKEEALSALIALGFNRARAIQAIHKVSHDRPQFNNVEELIKLALKALS